MRTQFGGDARLKYDFPETDADISAHNLVLGGAPARNKLLAKLAGKLPIDWSEKHVKTGKETFPATGHAVVMIYPNPLNPKKYVVLNSGFTFREYDQLNNARQVPKLPDFAIIDLSQPPNSRTPGGIASAGFFDERWELTSLSTKPW